MTSQPLLPVVAPGKTLKSCPDTCLGVDAVSNELNMRAEDIFTHPFAKSAKGWGTLGWLGIERDPRQPLNLSDTCFADKDLFDGCETQQCSNLYVGIVYGP